jgi:SGNH domain (fused to AT3 domains)
VPVPADLRPPLSGAAQDTPIIYADGCHLGFSAVLPPPCVFGASSSLTTVVLVGDSKAAQWFPALDLLARKHDWRLVSLTKSACTAADVTVWSGALGRAYSECDTWRGNVIARVASEHPSVVVVSDDRLYELALNGGPVPLAQHPDLWNAGLERTLRQLLAQAQTVILLADTPRSGYDVPACLMAHLSDARACATPLAKAVDMTRLAADRVAAAAAGARFVDPTTWVCPSDPCPAIIDHLLVYRGQDHLTTAFIDSLAPRLATALNVP